MSDDKSHNPDLFPSVPTDEGETELKRNWTPEEEAKAKRK